MGSNEVKQNGCAACHVLFTLVDKIQVSETEAADLLAEILLSNPHLNNQFIEIIYRNGRKYSHETKIDGWRLFYKDT